MIEEAIDYRQEGCNPANPCRFRFLVTDDCGSLFCFITFIHYAVARRD
jgi:hypothetical protein